MDNLDKTPFDDLLNQAFIETDFDNPENQKMLDAMSNSVLKDANLRMVKPSLLQRIIGRLNFKSILIIIGIAGGFAYLFNQSNLLAKNGNNYNPRNSSLEELEILNPELKLETESIKSVKPIRQKGLVALSNSDHFLNPISADYILPVIDTRAAMVKLDSLEEEAYRFPVLTEEEKIANKKRKEKMLKAFWKLDKDKYSLIDVSNQLVNKQGVYMQNYYMQTNEVTNIEYKTYLFDLLIKGRNEEFLNAKPNQKAWLEINNNEFMEKMVDLYFSHPAYDDYPVVNITREGAELYCKWLYQEFLKSPDTRNKYKIENVRLPYDFEWIYAAQGGNEKNIYPWGGPYLRNSKGIYLANFRPLKNNYNADGGLLTVKSESYTPNDFGLYNMSGNVSEMVYYFNSDTLHGTKGGNYLDVSANIQINSKDLNKGITKASPTIGFRPIIQFQNLYTRMASSLIDNKNVHVKHRKDQSKSMLNRLLDFSHRNPNSTIIQGGVLKLKEGSYYIDPFFVKTTEVSNAEYNLFLNDLSIKKRNEFKPSRKWNHEALNEFYSSHLSYKNYPVVNISREGALAYCKWLEQKINISEEFIAEEKNGTPIKVKVSLPTNYEWLAAASYMGKYNQYPWHSTLRNNGRKYQGQYCANFKHDNSERKESDKMIFNDNAELTSPVYSYWPNSSGIYNIGGNAAEMVTYENGEVGAKGGSWNKPEAYLKIHAEDPFLGITEPHNEIGFRPVIRIVK